MPVIVDGTDDEATDVLEALNGSDVLSASASLCRSKNIATANFGSNMTNKFDGIRIVQFDFHKLPLNKMLENSLHSSSVTS